MKIIAISFTSTKLLFILILYVAIIIVLFWLNHFSIKQANLKWILFEYLYLNDSPRDFILMIFSSHFHYYSTVGHYKCHCEQENVYCSKQRKIKQVKAQRDLIIFIHSLDFVFLCLFSSICGWSCLIDSPPRKEERKKDLILWNPTDYEFHFLSFYQLIANCPYQNNLIDFIISKLVFAWYLPQLVRKWR